MKRLVILNYMFLFDPSDTGFTSGSQFESYFADFCSAYGIDSQVVETAGSGTKAIYLTSMKLPESMSQTTMQKPQSRKQPGSLLKSITPSTQSDRVDKYNKGRFLKGKGYLVKK